MSLQYDNDNPCSRYVKYTKSALNSPTPPNWRVENCIFDKQKQIFFIPFRNRAYRKQFTIFILKTQQHGRMVAENRKMYALVQSENVN